MATSQAAIGIEFISGMGMPPVAFIELAAELGCPIISLGLQPMGSENPLGYPAWSLREDLALRADVSAAARANGVRIATGEVFIVMPGRDIADAKDDMDIMQAIGAERLNLLSFEPDRARAFDQFGSFTEMAAERAMGTLLEYMPGDGIGSLAVAADAVRHVGRQDFCIMLDAMHYFRSGSEPDELAALDSDLLGHLQLCDVPLVGDGDYGREALYDRLPPGEGELPLADFLAAAPASLTFALELPMLANASQGLPPKVWLAPAIETAAELIAKVRKTSS